MPSNHGRRPEITRRVARIAGHAESVRKMLADDRDCVDILQQMTAVINALESARQALLEDHLEHCIADAVDAGRGERALEELRKTLKFAFR
jgi:CsoR family transcriptional regulator, copper-sensing transcriptional repressor